MHMLLIRDGSPCSLLALASVLAWISALFLMEILARTESLFQSGYFRSSSNLHENLLESPHESVSRSSRSRDRLGMRIALCNTPASLANDDHTISDTRKCAAPPRRDSLKCSPHFSLILSSPPPPSLHRFETNSVVGLYFGRRWEIAYTICIVLFIFSGLWAYATVFANSMMVFVPFPGLSAGLKPASTNSTLATVRRARLCVSGSRVCACCSVCACCEVLLRPAYLMSVVCVSVFLFWLCGVLRKRDAEALSRSF
jgi:hypothetical protein